MAEFSIPPARAGLEILNGSSFAVSFAPVVVGVEIDEGEVVPETLGQQEVFATNEFKKSVVIEAPNGMCMLPRISMEEGEEENDKVLLEPGVDGRSEEEGDICKNPQGETRAPTPTLELLQGAVQAAEARKVPPHVGEVHSSVSLFKENNEEIGESSGARKDVAVTSTEQPFTEVKKKSHKKKRAKSRSEDSDLNMNLIKLSQRLKGNGKNKGGASKAKIPVDRVCLWRLLSDYIDSEKGPWAVCGDFNCMLNFDDQLNGFAMRSADFDELRNFVTKSDLLDLKGSGCWYTWSDKHLLNKRIWCKLDRTLVNLEFIDFFPNVVSLFPKQNVSDHCPTIIKFGADTPKGKWFRFQNFWTQTKEFKSCLSKNWGSSCSSPFGIQGKLKHLKQCLKVVMGEYMHEMNRRVEQERAKLLKSQSDLEKISDDQTLIDEEAHVIKGRRARNRIHLIKLSDGTLYFDTILIRERFLDHFKSLLNGRFLSYPVDDSLFEVGPKVEEADCIMLNRQVTMNEVISALKQMPSNKVAGQDGFQLNSLKLIGMFVGRTFLNQSDNFSEME
ncbi:hypothetical protein QQ045_022165 [Rhodiola kirilowii]